MTIAPPPPSVDVWTYERYLNTPIPGRFEIIEGVLNIMPSPNVPHQIEAVNLVFDFSLYQRSRNNGLVITAPSDVLIRRYPRLQTRQPDVYYISLARLRQAGGIPEHGPLLVGPELVVEIISASETEQDVLDKTTDYREIGVLEMWRVYRKTQTVDVVALTEAGANILQSYGAGETVVSRVFPDLSVAVNAIFATPNV